jgi:hypothetical protein
MRHDAETANRHRKSKTALEENLDIIIEGKVCGSILQKQPESIVVCKIFKLQSNPTSW